MIKEVWVQKSTNKSKTADRRILIMIKLPCFVDYRLLTTHIIDIKHALFY